MGTADRPAPTSHRGSHPGPTRRTRRRRDHQDGARLLVELVKLTPLGYNTLRDTDPAQALALLTEGDKLVANLTREAERRRDSDEVNLLRSHNPFDDLKPIDPARALGHNEETA